MVRRVESERLGGGVCVGGGGLCCCPHAPLPSSCPLPFESLAPLSSLCVDFASLLLLRKKKNWGRTEERG